MKKKADVIKMDDNGNVIEVEKKKIDWKGIGKAVLFGVTSAVVGIIAFCAVGAAMCAVSDSEESDESCDSNDGESSVESTDSGSNGSAEE